MATFADQIVEHSEKLVRYAHRFTGKRNVADDLVQETILRALVHGDQFRPGTNMLGWLYTILRNCYYNEFRRTRRYCALGESVRFGEQPLNSTDQIWAV